MKKALLFCGISFLILIISTPVSAQLYWGGAGDAWNSAGWSTSNSGPFNSPWTDNSHVVFNIDGTISAPSAVSNFLSLTCNANVSFSSSGSTIGTNGTIATIDVAAGKTFDFGNQGFSTAAGTGFIKNGLGVLALHGGDYHGGFTLNGGTVIVRSVSAFGQSNASDLTINGGTIAAASTKSFSASKFVHIVVGGNFALGATTGLASPTANLNFASPVSLGAADRTITLNGTGEHTFSGIISSTGGGLITGAGSTGTLVLSGANTYTGTTTLTGGTLSLGAADVIPDLSTMVFNGGTLSTGAFSETYASLMVVDNSNIIFKNSVQSHHFAASASAVWTSGKTLTINGWAGNYDGSSGTKAKLFVGNNGNGLTADQLKQIKFLKGSVSYDAAILSTGEIVPNTLSVLPITLSSFLARPVDENMLVAWSMASEKENERFELLRSVDGINFKTITSMSAVGNSSNVQSYSFVDKNPYAGTNYYQLKQIDVDGTMSTSNIIFANVKIAETKVSAFASNHQVKIYVNSPTQKKCKIALFDIGGAKIEEKEELVLNKGYNEFEVNRSLRPGIYFISLTDSRNTISVKFMK